MTEWRIIPSAPLYAASDDGRIKRVARGRGAVAGRILKPIINRHGYQLVSLYAARDPQTQRQYQVSRLVCETFHGPAPTARHEAAHNDGCPQNNAPANLRWATHAENMGDKKRHGTEPMGERHHCAKLTAASVSMIRDRLARKDGTLRSLGREFGVSPATIHRANTGENWGSSC
jgi:hypothetical protein